MNKTRIILMNFFFFLMAKIHCWSLLFKLYPVNDFSLWNLKWLLLVLRNIKRSSLVANVSNREMTCQFLVCIWQKSKSQLILLFSLFLLLFMDPTALFDTIYGFHCTISTNFYLYLRYFQQKVFSSSKISRLLVWQRHHFVREKW